MNPIKLMKFNEDKNIYLKFKTNLNGLNLYYFNSYLSDDFLNDTSNIILPKLFNKSKISSKEYNFKISTELELERNQNNNIKEYLYFIF